MSMEAFVSLATNDSYSIGALTLGKSLRDSGSTRRLALMVTSGVTGDMRSRLSCVWDELVDIEELDSGDVEHLALLSRPELGVTFSKINAWRLVQYSKCVFLDADTLILQNVDELFEREEFSAAPDIGWPDCFNSGVFVFEPSLQTFYNLMELSRQTGSFDGGDQGLLNLYWSDWATKDIKHHLPFTFNVTPNVTYGYAPAFQKFGQDMKIVHFIGAVKPWQHRYLQEVDAVILHPGSYSSQNVAQDYIKRWWQVYSSLEKDGTSKWSHKPHHHMAPSPPSPPSPFFPSKEHGSGHTPLDPSTVGCTECDDVANMQVTCDSHVTANVPPSMSHDPQALAPPTLVEGGGDAILVSDSVLNSPPQPPPNTHLPPHLPTSSPSLKSTGYFTTGSQSSTSMSGTGAGLEHRKAFEIGALDVQGRDSFQNIQAHIDSQLETPEDEPAD